MPSPFVGTWKLVSQHILFPDGRIELARGKNPDGILMYDATGNMSVQLMRTDERAAEFNDMLNLEQALQGFLSYYGRYEVDEAAGTVRHLVTGSSCFVYRNTTQVRHYQFTGNTLTLKAQSPIDESTRLLVWQRIG